MIKGLHQALLERVVRLQTDYRDYGGEIVRWETPEQAYPDCSCGCRHFAALKGQLGASWGVCTKLDGPRFGLLTFEHQAGMQCFEVDPRARDEFDALMAGAEPVATTGDVTELIRFGRDQMDGRNRKT